MYLPAEAVYYELVCGRLGGESSPLGYALERRVIPVSPSTLTRICWCSCSASRACRSRSTHAR